MRLASCTMYNVHDSFNANYLIFNVLLKVAQGLNVMNLVSRGKGQVLTMEPYLYSMDPDFPELLVIIIIYSLNFKLKPRFCSLVHSNDDLSESSTKSHVLYITASWTAGLNFYQYNSIKYSKCDFKAEILKSRKPECKAYLLFSIMDWSFVGTVERLTKAIP